MNLKKNYLTVFNKFKSLKMNIRRKKIKETKIVFNEEIIQQNTPPKIAQINTTQISNKQNPKLKYGILKNPNHIKNKITKPPITKNHYRSKSEILTNEENIQPRKIKTCIIDFKKIFQNKNTQHDNKKTLETNYDKNTKLSEQSYPYTASPNRYIIPNYPVEQTHNKIFSTSDLIQVKNTLNKNVSDFSNKSSYDEGSDSFWSDPYRTYTKTAREMRTNRSVNVYRKTKCLDKYRNNGLSFDKKDKNGKRLNNSIDKIRKITINLNNINSSRNLKLNFPNDKINDNIFTDYMQINNSNRVNNFSNCNNYPGTKRGNNILEYDLCIISNKNKASKNNNHNNYLTRSNNFVNNNAKNNIYFENNNKKKNVNFFDDGRKNYKNRINDIEKKEYESNLNSTNEKTIKEKNKVNFSKIFSPRSKIPEYNKIKEFYDNSSNLKADNLKNNKKINSNISNIVSKKKEDNYMDNLKQQSPIRNIPLKLNKNVSQKKNSNSTNKINKSTMNKKDLVANIIVINNNEYHLWNEFSRLYNKAK